MGGRVINKCRPLLSNVRKCFNHYDCKSARCDKGKSNKCKNSDIKYAKVGEGCYTDDDCLSKNCEYILIDNRFTFGGKSRVKQCVNKKSFHRLFFTVMISFVYNGQSFMYSIGLTCYGLNLLN